MIAVLDSTSRVPFVPERLFPIHKLVILVVMVERCTIVVQEITKPVLPV